MHKILSEYKLDAFLVLDRTNASYLSNTTIPECAVVLTKQKDFFFTDPRFQEDAKDQVRGFRTVIAKNDFYPLLKQALKKVKTVGFESEHLSYSNYLELKKQLPGVKLVPIKGAVETKRIIKNKQEIKTIRRSVKISKKVFKHIQKTIKPGLTEREICAEIERKMKQEGAHAPAFDTIVASGPNSSRPHAAVTNRKIKRSDIVLVDFGADFNGYNSDLTRVVFLGKISTLFRQIYSIVLEAQEKAISRVKPGVKISEIDKIARETIAKRGYGKYFLHATGHGIGRQVHERPNISLKNQDLLKPGMIFTVEPAIYFPGKFGIRIEDMVLVTGKHCEVLTDDIDKSI